MVFLLKKLLFKSFLFAILMYVSIYICKYLGLKVFDQTITSLSLVYLNFIDIGIIFH